MKKRISNWLLCAAKKLDPKGVIENVPEVEDYEPRKIGLTVEIPKKEIRNYKKKNDVSDREARKNMVLDAKGEIRRHVIDTITKNSLIETKVIEHGKDMIVVGEMKVYIRKGDED